MRTELQSLTKIFSESVFRIPDFQRGYSWGQKQLKEFWNDLVDLEPAKSHYTGVLTLENVPESIWQRWDDDRWIIQSKRYVPYHVVDGQQRLTTSVILIQAILEKLDDSDQLNHYSKQEIYSKFICQKPGRSAISFALLFGYEKDNPSYEFLKRNVLQLESGNHSIGEETIYTKNLASAKTFFVEKLSSIDFEGVEQLFEKLTQRFLFNTFIMKNEVDVFVAFETMNNRGKPLSNLEILKNRLIYLSTRVFIESAENEVAERAELRAVINESWKAAYHYLGQISGDVLEDDFFLRLHFFMCFGGDVVDFNGEHPEWDILDYGDDDGYKTFLLDKIFTARRVRAGNDDALTVDEIYSYAIDLKDSVRVFHCIREPEHSGLSDGEKVWLSRLLRLSIITRILGKYELPCLLLAIFRMCRNSKKRVEMFEVLERWEVFRLLGKYEFSGRSNLVLIAVKLVNNMIDIDEAIAQLRKEADQFAASSALKKRLSMVGKEWGSYKWPFIKYLLFEYEQSLRLRSRAHRNKLDWKDFNSEDYHSDYVTIEHIYPQKVVDKSWDDFKRFTVKQRNILRHSMGNLLPLSRPKNSSLGNKSFENKKASNGDVVGYLFGCYSEQEVAQCEAWTASAVGSRCIRLLSFLEERWSVSLGGHDEKLSMLGLGFIASEVPSMRLTQRRRT